MRWAFLLLQYCYKNRKNHRKNTWLQSVCFCCSPLLISYALDTFLPRHKFLFRPQGCLEHLQIVPQKLHPLRPWYTIFHLVRRMKSSNPIPIINRAISSHKQPYSPRTSRLPNVPVEAIDGNKDKQFIPWVYVAFRSSVTKLSVPNLLSPQSARHCSTCAVLPLSLRTFVHVCQSYSVYPYISEYNIMDNHIPCWSDSIRQNCVMKIAPH